MLVSPWAVPSSSQAGFLVLVRLGCELHHSDCWAYRNCRRRVGHPRPSPACCRTTILPPLCRDELDDAVTSIGSNAVRGLELSVGLLDDNGFSMRGDGLPARPELNRGETATVMGYEPRRDQVRLRTKGW